jgi:hypothetical protein
MPCQVWYRGRYVDITHNCLVYVIESANALCLNSPQTEFIRRCVVHWESLMASSGNNLLDLDLDRLVTDEGKADEVQDFLTLLRQWVSEHCRVEFPDGRAVTWVDRILGLFTQDPAGARPV